ncbi:MAG: HTTM domain-containing protein, partial [Pseudomonadota bacterium]
MASTPIAGTVAERLWVWLHAPRDIAALAVFRMLLGGLMCVGALRFMHNDWIERLYLDPDFHFKYWG